jgi:glutamyl-tRNA synthetase
MGEIRVRFAPSPTGSLHVGAARTALFNFLFARSNKGKFILRIEDTDTERSKKIYEDEIIASLKWLGIDWDEGPDVGGPYGPYRQSQRLELYRNYAHNLLKKGLAYYCYCSEDELVQRRRERIESKRSIGYDGRCRDLSPDKRKEYESQGRKPIIRFKVEKESPKVRVEDLLKGKLEFDIIEISDFTILRSDGVATYNLAVVVDDIEMGITHIIRGDEHISNTPRQVLLYEAFGKSPPAFCHLPIILAEDGSKLSKRHGAVSISYYRDIGFLPEAVVNYLCLLGWSPPDGSEIFTLSEIIEKFTLNKIGTSPAIFDFKKFKWLNGTYIKKMDSKSIVTFVLPYLDKEGLLKEDKILRNLEGLIDLIKSRVEFLSQIPKEAHPYFDSNFEILPEAETLLRIAKSKEIFSALLHDIDEIDFEPEVIKCFILSKGKEMGISGKSLFMPIRAALIGTCSGPEVHLIMHVLGRDECKRRFKKALDFE